MIKTPFSFSVLQSVGARHPAHCLHGRQKTLSGRLESADVISNRPTAKCKQRHETLPERVSGWLGIKWSHFSAI